jgi:hypothetical protein
MRPTTSRLWLPGDHSIAAHLRLPTDIAPATYRLALWLPDAAENLRSHADYSLRFANDDIWHEESGDNTLGELRIVLDAPGESDPSAGGAFEVIQPVN